MDTGSVDFATAYERHAAGVFQFALYLTGNRADAEDITAETFVRAFAAPDRIRAETMKSYLFTIARRLFRRGLRRRGRHQPLPDDVADPRASVSARVEAKSELEAIMAKLQLLAHVDRAALLMRTFHGLPYQEIAQALEISLSSAKVKVHRARAALIRIGAAPPTSTSEEPS
ncbi:MAG: RNA polymerase sigma factor [Acidobacteriota bacterium]